MKHFLAPLAAGLLSACLSPASGQEYKEHISKQFTLQKPAASTVVAIYNLNGSVKVEGYSGSQVVIEADETISADDQATLEQGKKEVRLGFDQTGDTVRAYLTGPYDTRPHNGWYENREHIEYHYTTEFTIKVPYEVNLVASTINHGSVTVAGVTGKLKVNNVNGSIAITGARNTTNAHTVNGPVTVSYVANPPEASSYSSINGDLTISYKRDLAADLQFKSMNGKFYTDFDNVETLPAKVVQNRTSTGSSTTYKLSKDTQVRVGAGGKLFKFETLNGNIYIKNQEKI